MRALRWGSHTPSACFTGSAFPFSSSLESTLTEVLPLSREHPEHSADATHGSGLSGSVMQMRT